MAKLSGKISSRTFKKAPNVAYQDVHDKLDLVWCVKGLIIIHSNLIP